MAKNDLREIDKLQMHSNHARIEAIEAQQAAEESLQAERTAELQKNQEYRKGITNSIDNLSDTAKSFKDISLKKNYYSDIKTAESEVDNIISKRNSFVSANESKLSTMSESQQVDYARRLSMYDDQIEEQRALIQDRYERLTGKTFNRRLQKELAEKANKTNLRITNDNIDRQVKDLESFDKMKDSQSKLALKQTKNTNVKNLTSKQKDISKGLSKNGNRKIIDGKPKIAGSNGKFDKTLRQSLKKANNSVSNRNPDKTTKENLKKVKRSNDETSLLDTIPTSTSEAVVSGVQSFGKGAVKKTFKIGSVIGKAVGGAFKSLISMFAHPIPLIVLVIVILFTSFTSNLQVEMTATGGKDPRATDLHEKEGYYLQKVSEIVAQFNLDNRVNLDPTDVAAFSYSFVDHDMLFNETTAKNYQEVMDGYFSAEAQTNFIDEVCKLYLKQKNYYYSYLHRDWQNWNNTELIAGLLDSDISIDGNGDSHDLISDDEILTRDDAVTNLGDVGGYNDGLVDELDTYESTVTRTYTWTETIPGSSSTDADGSCWAAYQANHDSAAYNSCLAQNTTTTPDEHIEHTEEVTIRVLKYKYRVFTDQKWTPYIDVESAGEAGMDTDVFPYNVAAETGRDTVVNTDWLTPIEENLESEGWLTQYVASDTNEVGKLLNEEEGYGKENNLFNDDGTINENYDGTKTNDVYVPVYPKDDSQKVVTKRIAKWDTFSRGDGEMELTSGSGNLLGLKDMISISTIDYLEFTDYDLYLDKYDGKTRETIINKYDIFDNEQSEFSVDLSLIYSDDNELIVGDNENIYVDYLPEEVDSDGVEADDVIGSNAYFIYTELTSAENYAEQNLGGLSRVVTAYDVDWSEYGESGFMDADAFSFFNSLGMGEYTPSMGSEDFKKMYDIIFNTGWHGSGYTTLKYPPSSAVANSNDSRGWEYLDCSNFVRHVLSDMGYNLISQGVRTAQQIYNWCTYKNVPASDVQPGDLVFFFFKNSSGQMYCGHVGIVAEDTSYMYNSLNPTQNFKTTKITNYYVSGQNVYVAYGRP